MEYLHCGPARGPDLVFLGEHSVGLRPRYSRYRQGHQAGRHLSGRSLRGLVVRSDVVNMYKSLVAILVNFAYVVALHGDY